MRVRDAAVTRPGRLGSPLVPSYDRDTVGRWSERIARFLGTGKYLAMQTCMVIIWILLNITLAMQDRWDEYPFILLNLLLSCVAALQGAILLIAARRSDQISAELATHDYQTNVDAADMIRHIEALTQEIHARVGPAQP